jgi:GT2 family glycosyltransferase
MKKKVAIIILNWNGYKMTVDCLKSLFKITYSEYKIFLVDNGSSDGSIAKLKDQFPNVDYLELDNNYGFTGGNNRGIEYARKKYSPEYILLLNNDTIVDVCFLSLMVETAEKDSQCGAVVPKIFFLEPSNHLYYAGGYLNRLSGMGEHYGWRQKDSNRYSVPRKVTFMNACASLIRMKVFESV